MAYIEGFVAAVPAAMKAAYRKHVAGAASLFKEFGVTRMVETWGDEVPDGKLTDFKSAVKARPDEVIVFSWLEYPDKATRDKANERIIKDPRMKEMGDAMPFDGQRMIFGGFAPIVDDGSRSRPGYVDGSLLPIPVGNKNAFRELAAKQATLLKKHGATRVVDGWGDDVPDGEVTDYKGAVKALSDEKVVYAWIEWPSKQVRDKAWKKAMDDPVFQPDKMLYDGKRMVYGGFAPILDE
jgi:uncharacterized protein YbaA (DUF1428 family)